MFNPHSSNPARRPRALGGNPIAPESLHPQKNQQNNQHRRSNVQRNNYHRASNIRQNINNNNNTRNKNHFTQDDSIYFVHNDLISNNETDFNDNINQRNNRRNNHPCRKSDQFQQEDLEYDQTLKESLKEFKQKEVQDLFEEIYNPVCLRQILQKLSGVDPDNSLFQKFYTNE